MNPMKCAFGVSVGKFSGFLVHHKGIIVDPAKAYNSKGAQKLPRESLLH